jgi:hypothetical protein
VGGAPGCKSGIVQPFMPEDSAPAVLNRRLPLYAYLEPLWAGRRVLEIGAPAGGADYLTHLGAARVVISDGDLAGLDERFDVVVVPEADTLVRRPGTVAAWRKLLADGGRLVVAVGNAERPGASGGLGYYELHDALAPHLPLVQMLGVTPFLGVGLVEFDGSVDALRIDSRLVKESEPPISYVAIAGAEPVAELGYALVQLPWKAMAAVSRGGDHGHDLFPELGRKLADAESALRVARAQGEELAELRARLRRAAEDRAALDAENAKLRRALADADESVMSLTRRTTEDMAVVAERLATTLRGPLEADTRAASAELLAVRDELDRLRLKLVESDARAAAAEQRLEEVGASSRERLVALEDALERQRLAESELGRARREAARLESEARAAAVDGRTLEEQARALTARDERIARLEGDKQDLLWRLAELEDKLRQAIARAVQAGGPRAGSPPAEPPRVATGDDVETARRARQQALEDFHRASSAHVGEITELRAAVSEQAALVAELEDALAAAETRASGAESDAAALRRTSKELEEADRSRRSRLAELEGKLLRLEHERKLATGRADGTADADRRLRELEDERDRLRARIGVLEVASSAPRRNGHDLGHAAAGEVDALRDDPRAEAGRLASAAPQTIAAADGLAAPPAGRSVAAATIAPAPGIAKLSDDPALSGAFEVAAGRLENTLGNYRERAGRLRDDLEGIRRRLDSLSPAEISGFLEELGEDLAELG